ncbi:hypothetical protein D9M69_509230 [compost metagenome]
MVRINGPVRKDNDLKPVMNSIYCIPADPFQGKLQRLGGFTGTGIEIGINSFSLEALIVYKTQLIKLLDGQHRLIQLHLPAVFR